MMLLSSLMIMIPPHTPLDITLRQDLCAATMEAVCGNIITHGPLGHRFGQWDLV